MRGQNRGRPRKSCCPKRKPPLVCRCALGCCTCVPVCASWVCWCCTCLRCFRDWCCCCCRGDSGASSTPAIGASGNSTSSVASKSEDRSSGTAKAKSGVSKGRGGPKGNNSAKVSFEMFSMKCQMQASISCITATKTTMNTKFRTIFLVFWHSLSS